MGVIVDVWVIVGVMVGVRLIVGVGLTIKSHKTVSSLSQPSELTILTPTAAESSKIDGTGIVKLGGMVEIIWATSTQSLPYTSQIYMVRGGVTPCILYNVIWLISNHQGFL